MDDLTQQLALWYTELTKKKTLKPSTVYGPGSIEYPSNFYLAHDTLKQVRDNAAVVLEWLKKYKSVGNGTFVANFLMLLLDKQKGNLPDRLLKPVFTAVLSFLKDIWNTSKPNDALMLATLQPTKLVLLLTDEFEDFKVEVSEAISEAIELKLLKACSIHCRQRVYPVEGEETKTSLTVVLTMNDEMILYFPDDSRPTSSITVPKKTAEAVDWLSTRCSSLVPGKATVLSPCITMVSRSAAKSFLKLLQMMFDRRADELVDNKFNEPVDDNPACEFVEKLINKNAFGALQIANKCEIFSRQTMDDLFGAVGEFLQEDFFHALERKKPTMKPTIGLLDCLNFYYKSEVSQKNNKKRKACDAYQHEKHRYKTLRFFTPLVW